MSCVIGPRRPWQNRVISPNQVTVLVAQSARLIAALFPARLFRPKRSLCRCRVLTFACMRILLSSLFVGIVGLLAGFGWQWRPVAVRSLIERSAELTAVPSEHAAPPDAAVRFLEAFQKKGDPLRMEHDLWMAVQSLDATDLRVVSADWAGVMATAERAKDIPLNTRNALLAAVVERWLTLDPNGAMTRLGELTTTLKDGDYIPEDVMAVLARKQPQALVDFIIAAKAGTRRDGLAYQAAVALAHKHNETDSNGTKIRAKLDDFLCWMSGSMGRNSTRRNSPEKTLFSDEPKGRSGSTSSIGAWSIAGNLDFIRFTEERSLS